MFIKILEATNDWRNFTIHESAINWKIYWQPKKIQNFPSSWTNVQIHGYFVRCLSRIFINNNRVNLKKIIIKLLIEYTHNC